MKCELGGAKSIRMHGKSHLNVGMFDVMVSASTDTEISRARAPMPGCEPLGDGPLLPDAELLTVGAERKSEVRSEIAG